MEEGGKKQTWWQKHFGDLPTNLRSPNVDVPDKKETEDIEIAKDEIPPPPIFKASTPTPKILKEESTTSPEIEPIPKEKEKKWSLFKKKDKETPTAGSPKINLLSEEEIKRLGEEAKKNKKLNEEPAPAITLEPEREMTPEEKFLESQLKNAREKYVEEYKIFTADRKAGLGMYSRAKEGIFGTKIDASKPKKHKKKKGDRFMRVNLLEENSETPLELKKLEAAYDQVAVELGQEMFRVKEVELRSLYGNEIKTENEIQNALDQYKQTEIFKRIIIEEQEALNKLKVENLPPKEKNILKKGLDAYLKLGWKKKMLISFALSGAFALAVTPSAVAAAGSGLTWFGIKTARTLAGVGLGKGTGKLIDLLVKDSSGEKRKAAEEELAKLFGGNDVASIKKQYASIVEQERKSKRNRLITKAALSMAAGGAASLGTSYGAGKLLHSVPDQINTSGGHKPDDMLAEPPEVTEQFANEQGYLQKNYSDGHSEIYTNFQSENGEITTRITEKIFHSAKGDYVFTLDKNGLVDSKTDPDRLATFFRKDGTVQAVRFPDGREEVYDFNKKIIRSYDSEGNKIIDNYKSVQTPAQETNTSPSPETGTASQESNMPEAPQVTPAPSQAVPPLEASAPKVSTPLDNITVHKGQGVEHAFIKQIETNPKLAQELGFKGNVDDAKALHAFAQREAHVIALKQGYVDNAVNEVRVKMADKASYEIKTDGQGNVTGVEEKLDGKLVDAKGVNKEYEYKVSKSITPKTGTIDSTAKSEVAVDQATIKSAAQAEVSGGGRPVETLSGDKVPDQATIKAAALDQTTTPKPPTPTIEEAKQNVHEAYNKAKTGAQQAGQKAESYDEFQKRTAPVTQSTSEILQKYPAFAKNHFKLPADKLADAAQVYESNVNHMLSVSGHEHEWIMVKNYAINKGGRFKDVINNRFDETSPVGKLLHKAYEVTGLKANSGFLFAKKQSVEQWFIKALQKAAKEGTLDQINF